MRAGDKQAATTLPRTLNAIAVLTVIRWNSRAATMRSLSLDRQAGWGAQMINPIDLGVLPVEGRQILRLAGKRACLWAVADACRRAAATALPGPPSRTTERLIDPSGIADSGKTNYVGRVWPALDGGQGALHAAHQPTDIKFVLEVADHLFAGHFAPRTEFTAKRRDFEVVVAERGCGTETSIVVPDISGELWLKAVNDCGMTTEWMEELRRADGALLFVRVGSDQDVRPLDWVTSQALLEKVGGTDEPGLPTQVTLCELIRFLEVSLSNRPGGGRPRLAVVVSAWDLVDKGTFDKGPVAYLGREYPMAAGRLRNVERLDVRVFGLSVVGGDLKVDEAFRDEMLEKGLDGHGWVAVEDPIGRWRKDGDLTLPIAWVVGS